MKTMTFKDFIEKIKARDRKIMELRKKEHSLRDIASKFDISYERVRQIVERENKKEQAS